MWLLKLHAVVSVLFLLSSKGVLIVFEDRIKRFKTESVTPKKKKRGFWLLFFCPGINAMLMIGLWFMALCDNQTVELIVSSKQDKEAK